MWTDERIPREAEQWLWHPPDAEVIEQPSYKRVHMSPGWGSSVVAWF